MKKVKEYKLLKDQEFFEESMNSYLSDGWKILKIETVAVNSTSSNDIVCVAHLVRNKKVG